MNLFDSATISTSFEDSTTTGWGNYAGVASLASVASNAAHGTRSMRVTATSAGGNVATSTTVFSPSTPGQVYSFGFYAVSSQVLQIDVYWHTQAGTYLSSSTTGFGVPTDGAARLTFNNVTAPAQADKFFIAITALAVPANGTFYIDAVQYEQAAVATPYTDHASLSAAAVALTNAKVASDADWIMSAQLTDGGISHYPDNVYMVPYFSHMAAMGLARATQVTGDTRYTNAVWRWLNWYARHMDSSSSFVTDYNVNPVGGSVPAGSYRPVALSSTNDFDSTDSYAGMFLLAAYKTWRVSGETSRLNALSTGLHNAITAIQGTQESDGLTWAKPSYRVKYLMDNSEAWAGLQAAYAIGGALGDTLLQSRAQTAFRAMAIGVEGMWNSANGSYNWAKFDSGAQNPCNWAVDYPDASSQVWPVAFGLTRGVRAAALVSRYNLEYPQWDQPVAGWASMQVGQTMRALAAAASARGRSVTTNRAWPWMPATSGQLIVLESLDLSYLAPLAL